MTAVIKIVNKLHVKKNTNLLSLPRTSTFSSFTRQMSNCIFCKIISGDAPGEILYQDDEIAVFKDIKPASKFHFLAVPKEHVLGVNTLNRNHLELIDKLVTIGKQILNERGGDPNDVRLGFHLPPFNSIAHLHLHVISPVSEMSFISRCIFRPNNWWFSSVDQIKEKIGNSKL